jgi:hypothetical protein
LVVFQVFINLLRFCGRQSVAKYMLSYRMRPFRLVKGRKPDMRSPYNALS